VEKPGKEHHGQGREFDALSLALPQEKVELPRSELLEVLFGGQEPSDVRAQMTFRDIPLRQFVVAESPGKVQKSSKVLLREEPQNGMCLRIYPFLEKLL